MLAPKGTPAAAIAKLHASIQEVVRDPETAQAFQRLGYEPMQLSQKDSAAMLKAEHDRWGPVLKAANVQPQ